MPEYFDPQVIAQRQRDEERERWMKEEVEPALERVYGGACDPPAKSDQD